MKAVFLDRDGVINENRPDYVTRWEDFAFLPGALEAIGRLSQLPWPIAVVTNQSAVGRGLLPEATLREIHRQMVVEVERAGGRIDLVLSCIHHPDLNCVCRKPGIALFRVAASRLNVDLESSYFVGDAPSDLAAARRAGMRFILVRSGKDTTSAIDGPDLAAQADFAAVGLEEAAYWIFAQEGLVRKGAA